MRKSLLLGVLSVCLLMAYPAHAQFIGVGGPGGGGGSGGGTGGGSFSAITPGTNTLGAMIVGSASLLSFEGSGSINANLFNGQSIIRAIDGGTGMGIPSDDAVLVSNGTIWEAKIIPNCANPTTDKLLFNIATNTWGCGTDQSSGPPSFMDVTTGVNSSATMECDTGCALTFLNSGSINASLFRGNATVAVAHGGTNLTSATDDAVMIGNGTTFQLKVIPDCDDPINSKVLYDAATNALSCGTDQSAGGGTTFDAIGTGANTTAIMTVGTGGSMIPAGTGLIAASHLRPLVTTVNAGNSPFTATDGHMHIFCDTTAAGRTITLPAATVTARLYVYNLGSNACTINRAGADTITTGLSTGLTSLDIRNAGSSFWFQSDQGTVWYVGG